MSLLSWVCMYSLFSFSLGLWGHFAKTWVSTITYKDKNTKYLAIKLLLTWEQVLLVPTVQIWAQISTILTPKNLLEISYSYITNCTQTTLLQMNVNFPKSGALTCNIERVSYDQFVMEEWQTITMFLGVRWWNYELSMSSELWAQVLMEDLLSSM